MQIDPGNLEASFAVNALGGNERSAAAERWQVLSPVKGDAANTIILNRRI